MIPTRAGPLVMRQAPMAGTLRSLLPRYGLPGPAFHQVTHLSTHAFADAALAAEAGPCPVLLFSGGYFIETLTSSSGLMEASASHGYVVASLSHPGEDIATVFPDGRAVGLESRPGGDVGPEGPESLAVGRWTPNLCWMSLSAVGQPARATCWPDGWTWTAWARSVSRRAGRWRRIVPG